MSSISNLVTNIREWYSKINPANMTGAIDVIIVQQPDGTYLSSPFHVRFGKYGVLKATEKIVDIEVNGNPVSIHMKLDDNGAAYFVEPVDADLDHSGDITPEFATSPIPQDSWLRYGARTLQDEDCVSDRQIEEIDTTVQPVVSKLSQSVQTNKQENQVADSVSCRGNPMKNSFKKKSSRDAIESKHSRNNSRASLKEMSPSDDNFLSDNFSEDPFLDSNENEMNIFEMDEEETFSERTGFVSAVESRKNSTSSFRIFDEPDRAVVNAETDSFLLSRLPDNDKLQAMLDSEHYLEEEREHGWTSHEKFLPKVPANSVSGFMDVPNEGASSDPNEEKKWEWGKLPTTSSDTEKGSSTPTETSSEVKASSTAAEDDQGNRWGLSYLWRGRTKEDSKSNSSQEEKTGIYLDELKDGDQEMLKMYIGRQVQHKQASPLMIPHVVDDDAESGTGPSLPMSPRSVETTICSGTFDDRMSRSALPEIQISLCGGIDSKKFSAALFDQSRITYDDFVMRLQLFGSDFFSSPDLVVKIGGQYFSWKSACPIIMATLLFGRNLPETLVEPHKEKLSSTETTSRKRSWWPLFSSSGADEMPSSQNQDSATEQITSKTEIPSNLETGAKEISTRYSIATQTNVQPADDEKPNSRRYRKTLRLSNDAIKLLNLQPGLNDIQFSVTTAYQGTTVCGCHLYLWKWSDKIVISDIDGTITKSDVLGHVLPVIGRDWAQSGVADLFTKIKNNGYHILYLSARAIGQASLTKDYLASIRQGDFNLPDGPLLLNPTSLISAFHREVIEKKPEKFKIACLNDVRSLFPKTLNPFFAGYGNRANDVIAYTEVGVPVSRIFTINHRGEVRHETLNYQTSYSNQSGMVDHLFPPINETQSLKSDDSPAALLEFSNFTYWREPLLSLNEPSMQS